MSAFRVSTQEAMSEVCQCKSRGTMRTHPQWSSHNSWQSQMPQSLDRKLSTLPSVKRRRAWEEGCSTRYLVTKKKSQPHPAECTLSVAESPKKLVSFSSKLPTYRKPSSSVCMHPAKCCKT